MELLDAPELKVHLCAGAIRYNKIQSVFLPDLQGLALAGFF